jgi:hypothetical protein
MTNRISDMIQEHIINCYDDMPQIRIRSIDKDENYVKDTGNSFICKKCKKTILEYE